MKVPLFQQGRLALPSLFEAGLQSQLPLLVSPTMNADTGLGDPHDVSGQSEAVGKDIEAGGGHATGTAGAGVSHHAIRAGTADSRRGCRRSPTMFVSQVKPSGRKPWRDR